MPWPGKVNICLQSQSTKEITLLRKIAVGEISSANSIMALLVPKPEENDIIGVEASIKKKSHGGK